MNEFLTIDENLRSAMRFFGDATGSGEIASLPGCLSIFSGLDYGVFNIALLEGKVSPHPSGPHTENLEIRLAEAARFFRERTLRWSFWLCEDLLDSQTRRRARQAFFEFGMRAISHPPGMLAPALSPPIRPLPPIECVPVSDAKTRQAFAEMTSVAFEIPALITHAVYTPERAWKGTYQGFVGLVNGRPISIVAIVAAGGALGIYSLGTLPAYRRQGYGEALLRAAVSETQRLTGLTTVILQSTDAGYALYRRMGFRDVTRYSVYLTR